MPPQSRTTQSEKKKLVESLKQSMIKPPSPQSITQSKKPQNYESYLNTAIDYSKNYDSSNSYLVGSVKKTSLVYNLDSDDSPKEDQHPRNDPSNQDPIDDEMMNEIEREIMRESNTESRSPAQRKIAKITGPKKKADYESDGEEPAIQTKTVPKHFAIRTQQSAKRDRSMEEPEEEQKQIVTEEEQKPKSMMAMRRKTAASIEPQPEIQPNGVKKLKQAANGGLRGVRFAINIPRMKSGLEIAKILNIKGSTKEDIKYACSTYDGKVLEINNIEMTFLYKDALIDYYQNILFSEEQTEEN